MLKIKMLFALLMAANVLMGKIDSTITDSVDPYKPRYAVLPLLFFLPETSLGFGVGGVISFRFKSEEPDSRTSQIQFGASYTLMDQILLYLPYRLFWKQGDYLTYGELGYYKYIYFFYGQGPNTLASEEEIYDLTYPRIRNSLLYQIKRGVYLGGRYWFDAFNITRVDSGGILERGEIAGARGGRAAGLGAVLNIDTRNDQFYPEQGWFVEGVVLSNTRLVGSEFEFLKISLDAARYYQLAGNHILALNLYGESNIGNVPFYQMALLGGNKRLRGLYEGRFRDNNALIFQAEYRWKFYKRFGMAAFTGLGNIFEETDQLNFSDTKFTYGAGIRFQLSKSQLVNLRLDIGLSPYGDPNYYITFGEAF